MSLKTSLAFALLLLGAASVPFGIASAASPSEIQTKRAQQAKQAELAKKKQLEEQKKKDEWYAEDRDRGLDIAEKYAPNHIKRVKKSNYIAKGDSIDTGTGKKGWQQYVNKYYKP